MRYLGVVALCVMLGGCVTSNSQPPAATASPPVAKSLPPYTLSKDDITAIQKGIRISLKDPDSARFGRMVAGDEGGHTVAVCLMVNAKNSYGGYTGEKPFSGLLFTNKNPKIFIPTGENLPSNLVQYRDQATLQLCSDKGLSL